MRTLDLRMKQICETTRQVATFLEQHPAVGHVYFPGLSHHSTFTTAERMYPNGTGGIVSFELHGQGRQVVSEFMRAADTIPFTATLADARTTISHPASTSHGFMTESERQELGITDELVRISVGLESSEQLTEELDVALRHLLD